VCVEINHLSTSVHSVINFQLIQKKICFSFSHFISFAIQLIELINETNISTTFYQFIFRRAKCVAKRFYFTFNIK